MTPSSLNQASPAQPRPTFCRICEAECGILAIVENDRVVDIKPNPDNPHSRGFMCTKPKAMLDIVNDDDRVLRPLRRVGGPGEFEPVSWDEALADITARLKSSLAQHGPRSFATFAGNPVLFDSSGFIAITGMRAAIGSPWGYSVNGEDAAAVIGAASLQFGNGGLLPFPDLWRTDFLLVLGANPWISKGSAMSEPQVRTAMLGITERGGRVVVVDPRRTETARNFEHVAIRPGADPWLLLGILKVLFDEGLVDRARIAEQSVGVERLESTVAQVDLAHCAATTGIAVDVIVDIARGFGSATGAAAYGRTGTCTQRFGTLNNMLINSLNVVTGNLNRIGGAMFANGALDAAKLAKGGGEHSLGKVRSRTINAPSVLGLLPSQALWRDITEPGEGQIRSLFGMACNPVLSSGAGGERLERALGELDLHVSFDLYINETNKHAHYVLPGTTFYERADIPLLGLGLQMRPSLYATDRMVSPRGEAREEWRVMNDICRRLGLGGAYPVAALRWLARIGLEVPPLRLHDLVIRTGRHGDLFGLRRSGWSIQKLLTQAPNGVSLAPHVEPRNLSEALDTPDRRVHLTPPEFTSEIARLLLFEEDESYPLRMIGLRELRSHNSWMHNAPRLMPEGRTATALVHPDDALAAGIDGDRARITSANGSVVMSVKVTDEVSVGTVAVPHGWGHSGGWQRANRAGGSNSNELASVEEIEAVTGTSILNGIPVRIGPVLNPDTVEG